MAVDAAATYMSICPGKQLVLRMIGASRLAGHSVCTRCIVAQGLATEAVHLGHPAGNGQVGACHQEHLTWSLDTWSRREATSARRASSALPASGWAATCNPAAFAKHKIQQPHQGDRVD